MKVRLCASRQHPLKMMGGDLEQNGDGPAPFAGSKTADNSVTLEPDPVEDLEEELIEIGFSPVAAAWIAGKVPA